MEFPAENLATAGFLVVSLALVLVAGRAWWLTRNQKILFVGAGFLLFFVKAILLTIGLFTTAAWGAHLLLPSVIIDVAILLLFWGAVLKRGNA